VHLFEEITLLDLDGLEKPKASSNIDKSPLIDIPQCSLAFAKAEITTVWFRVINLGYLFGKPVPAEDLEWTWKVLIVKADF
jgi:hypothetical protein